MAVDTLGHLIALTLASEPAKARSKVDKLCQHVQQTTGETVKLTWADQG